MQHAMHHSVNFTSRKGSCSPACRHARGSATLSELWQLAVSTGAIPKALQPAAANAVASVTCRSRVIEPRPLVT